MQVCYIVKNVHLHTSFTQSDRPHTLVIYTKDVLTYGKQYTQNSALHSYFTLK
jgi:hypothetical protein